jgi:hypothetical protein
VFQLVSSFGLAPGWLDALALRRNRATGALGGLAMVRTCAAASLGLLLMAASARAADADATAPGPSVTFAQKAAEHPASRGAALPILYGALAGLQAYDGWSTVNGVRRGAVESNRAMAGAATNPGAMWALKVGATSASVYAAERMWRRHRRVEAVATMVAVNSMMIAVAAHNASIMRQLK